MDPSGRRGVTRTVTVEVPSAATRRLAGSTRIETGGQRAHLLHRAGGPGDAQIHLRRGPRAGEQRGVGGEARRRAAAHPLHARRQAGSEHLHPRPQAQVVARGPPKLKRDAVVPRVDVVAVQPRLLPEATDDEVRVPVPLQVPHRQRAPVPRRLQTGRHLHEVEVAAVPERRRVDRSDGLVEEGRGVVPVHLEQVESPVLVEVEPGSAPPDRGHRRRADRRDRRIPGGVGQRQPTGAPEQRVEVGVDGGGEVEPAIVVDVRHVEGHRVEQRDRPAVDDRLELVPGVGRRGVDREGDRVAVGAQVRLAVEAGGRVGQIAGRAGRDEHRLPGHQLDVGDGPRGGARALVDEVGAWGPAIGPLAQQRQVGQRARRALAVAVEQVEPAVGVEIGVGHLAVDAEQLRVEVGQGQRHGLGPEQRPHPQGDGPVGAPEQEVGPSVVVDVGHADDLVVVELEDGAGDEVVFELPVPVQLEHPHHRSRHRLGRGLGGEDDLYVPVGVDVVEHGSGVGGLVEGARIAGVQGQGPSGMERAAEVDEARPQGRGDEGGGRGVRGAVDRLGRVGLRRVAVGLRFGLGLDLDGRVRDPARVRHVSRRCARIGGAGHEKPQRRREPHSRGLRAHHTRDTGWIDGLQAADVLGHTVRSPHPGVRHMSDVVAAGKVVVMHYTLSSPTGETIDTSAGGAPMPYLHGAGNIVPGLERQLTGAAVGDKVEAVVPPAEGYGEKSGRAPEGVPRDAFPPHIEPQPGQQFVARDPSGEAVAVWVDRVEDGTIYLTDEHPLAGVTLHFAIEIVAVREPTDEETAHGHPHGVDGTAGH